MPTQLLRRLPVVSSLPPSGGGSGASIGLVPPARSSGAGLGAGEDAVLLQVGDLARVAGKTVRAIHHYEELGLLRPSARSKGRFRLYEESAVTRLRWIGKLNDLGMSLGEIQEILASWEASTSAPGAMASVRGVYAQRLEATRAQIARLQDLEQELESSLSYLDTCEACDPAELVASCSTCQVHEEGDLPPELVAGIAVPAPGCNCTGASAKAPPATP